MYGLAHTGVSMFVYGGAAVVVLLAGIVAKVSSRWWKR